MQQLMSVGKCRSVSGFTLIELLVTIAVAIILVTVAAPNFSSMVKANRLAVASNDVLSSVLFARSQAVTEKMDASVSLGGSDGWPLTVAVDGDVVSSRKASVGNISIAWSSSPVSLSFLPTGRASEETSLCISLDGVFEKEIRVYPSGQIEAYPRGDFNNCPGG